MDARNMDAGTKTRKTRPVTFYAGTAVLLAAAAGAVFYVHKSRSHEISAVREARAVAADRGPRSAATARASRTALISWLRDLWT